MKRIAVGLALATFAGAVAAGDLSEPRYSESDDYSARVYYRVDFGGTRGSAQSVGLRFDSVRAEAAGAPSLLRLAFGETGLNQFAVNGVDLRGALLSSGQSEGGGFFGSLTAAQWAALGFSLFVFANVAADLSEDTTDIYVSGSGS